MNAVRVTAFGDSSVLRLEPVPERDPGPGEVLVAVRTAGINPGEIPIREGRFGGEPPFGQGSDFAGDVLAVGEGVAQWRTGDEVIGFSDGRNAQAFSVTLVGVLAAQLARRAGARVIGTASAANHAALEDLGVEPVGYGDVVADSIRALAPDGVDAFIDTHGSGNVDLALALGVPPQRVDTIADFAARRRGVKTDGMSTVADPGRVLAELARLLADGELVLPIKARYAIDDVRTAYDALAERHGLGKIVLEVGAGI